jgi:hypothetical protein
LSSVPDWGDRFHRKSPGYSRAVAIQEPRYLKAAAISAPAIQERSLFNSPRYLKAAAIRKPPPFKSPRYTRLRVWLTASTALTLGPLAAYSCSDAHTHVAVFDLSAKADRKTVDQTGDGFMA